MKALPLAIALFLAQGAVLAWTLPVWSEQSSTVVAPTFAVVDAARSVDQGELVRERGCADGLARSSARPMAYLCGAGLSWPVLGSSYASPIPYWPLGLVPLAGGSLLTTRLAGLLFGVLGLLALHALLVRFESRRHADVTVVLASLSSPYLFLHALAVYYETVPTLLLLVAALVWPRRSPPSAKRALAAGALVGLATLANVKALVIASFALGALWLSKRQWPDKHASAAAFAGFALPLLAVVGLALGDPHSGVSGQVGDRLATFFTHLSPEYILYETLNVAAFATDFAFYVAVAGGGEPFPPIPSGLVALALFFVASVPLFRALRRRPHSASAAIVGAVLWGYVVFVALVYQQTPSANYGPIVHVFPVLLAYALCALADRWAAWRAMSAERATAWATAALAVVLVLATHGRGSAAHRIAALDPAHLQQVAEWIAERPADGTVVTVGYNHAGVFDALAALPEPTLAAHPLFHECGDDETCLAERMALVACASEPRHVVLTARPARVDEPQVALLGRALERAAEGCGAALQRELQVPAGNPALEVVRVAP